MNPREMKVLGAVMVAAAFCAIIAAALFSQDQPHGGIGTPATAVASPTP